MQLQDELSVLQRARDLIARNWTKQAFARDVWGHKVDPWDPQARSFCMLGALQAVTGRRTGIGPWPLRRAAMELGLPPVLMVVNDCANNKEEVLAVFDKAIEMQLKEVYALEGPSKDWTIAPSDRPLMAGVS